MLQTLQIEEILEHLSTVHHWNAMSIEVFHAHLKSFRRLRAVLLKCPNFRADTRSSLCLLLLESFEAWWMSNWLADSSHWRIKSSLSGSLATLCWSVLMFLFCFVFQKCFRKALQLHMQSFIILHCCFVKIYLTLGHSTWKKQSTNIVSCRQTIVICLTESSLSSWCKNWAISSGVVPSMPCSCRYWMPLFGFLLNLCIMIHRTPIWAAYLDSAFFKYEDEAFIRYMFSLRLWFK